MGYFVKDPLTEVIRNRHEINKEKRQSKRDRLNALDWMIENIQKDFWNNLDFRNRSPYLDLREDLSPEVKRMVEKLWKREQMSTQSTDEEVIIQRDLYSEIMIKLREEIARLTRKWKL